MSDGRLAVNRSVPPYGIDLFDRDMTVTVAADVPLAVLQARLAEAGQWLPVDWDPVLPVGLLVERNSTGPLRLGYGGWRDLLLGCQFTNGRGELITAGGRAMKNVAGYDLTKFMVGNQGVFGTIVTITSRTYRLPTAALLATGPIDLATVNYLLTTSCRPQWMLLADGRLHCGYVGDERTIEFYEAALPSHQKQCNWIEITRQDLSADIAMRTRLWAGGQLRHEANNSADATLCSFRASVPPARILDLLDFGAADPVFGILVGQTRLAERETLRTRVAAAGGTIWFASNTGECLDVERELASNAVLQRLRDAFAV